MGHGPARLARSAIETTGMFDLEDLENAKLELAREADELDAFLKDLERLPPDESKMLRLHPRASLWMPKRVRGVPRRLVKTGWLGSC